MNLDTMRGRVLTKNKHVRQPRMAAARTRKEAGLEVRRVVDVPLKEVSGICLRRGQKDQMWLIAVGDRVATVAWVSLERGHSESLDWRTKSLARLHGSSLPKDDPQIEAICADGAGRVLLLQETPARAEFVDLDASHVIASIELGMEGRGAIARSWSDPEGSRGEGVVLLPGGHLLVAKEKDPAALIEFGPEGARSRGLVRGGALPSGARWPIRIGEHRFIALAIWLPDKALAKACADFSDLDVGPDGRLYLLSDKSAVIARIDDLAPGGVTATCGAFWRLRGLDGKPEGLAFTGDGHAIVALDRRKARNNLVILEPPIASADEAAPT
jgi:hypothetical protein